MLGDCDLAALDSSCTADRNAGNGDHAAENAGCGERARRGGGCSLRGVRRGPLGGAVTRGGFHAQRFLDAGHQACHGLRGVGAARLDGKLVALADAERHDGDHAACIRSAPVGAERGLGAECLGALRQQGRRPGMQPVAQGHDESVTGGRFFFRRVGCPGRRAGLNARGRCDARDFEQHLA